MMFALAIFSLFVAGVSAQEVPTYYNTVVLAHAILGPIVFIVLIPIGGLVIRVCNFKGVVRAHAVIQLLAYACFCFVFGSGVWFSYENGSWTHPHQILGIILFSLTTLQPFLGTIHHQMFKSRGHRTFMSITHVHVGRTIMPLGILNGGLGLLFGGDASMQQIEAYSIVGGLVWFFYSLAVAYIESRNVKAQRWLIETNGARTKMEMGIEETDIVVYEK